ncbi:hypothetical protein AMECASPLE_036782 [Ameca splendens]|uniref:Uncharacterized protein n=1 Tax=Ameca splendens TaxID=208324 RepID=A0ABV0Z5M4_9TELE
MGKMPRQHNPNLGASHTASPPATDKCLPTLPADPKPNQPLWPKITYNWWMHREVNKQGAVGRRQGGLRHKHTQVKGGWEVNTRAGEGMFPLGLVTMLFLVLFVWGCAGKERRKEETQQEC